MKSLSKIKGANLHTNFFKIKSIIHYILIIYNTSNKNRNLLKTNLLKSLDSVFDFCKFSFIF